MKEILRMRDYIIKQMASHHAIFTTPYFLFKADVGCGGGFKWLNLEAEEQFNEMATYLQYYNKIIAEYRHEQYLRDKEEYERNISTN